jgi:hypothetical protein
MNFGNSPAPRGWQTQSRSVVQAIVFRGLCLLRFPGYFPNGLTRRYLRGLTRKSRKNASIRRKDPFRDS